MSFTRNILPAVYSGMNKAVQGGGDNYSSNGGRRGAPPSIAARDKILLDLQEQAADKKKQIKEDYRELKKKIKENPYLQDALVHYEEYFSLQEKQIKALKQLLGDSLLKKDDQKAIKKEIATLEKNLA